MTSSPAATTSLPMPSAGMAAMRCSRISLKTPLWFVWRYVAHSCVRMFALLGGVLHTENHDFLEVCINRVEDEMAVLARHDLAHPISLLLSPDKGKQDEILQALIDGGTHTLRSGGGVDTNMICDGSQGLIRRTNPLTPVTLVHRSPTSPLK